MVFVVVVLVVALTAMAVLRAQRGGQGAHRAEVGPLGWVPGMRWRAVGPLARADARRLVRHPAFLLGVALTPLMLAAARQGEVRWLQMSALIALALVPLGWFTIVAVNLLALQPRRAGVDELFAAAPAPQPVRTTGLLVSGVVAVVTAAGFAAAWAVHSAATVEGATGSPWPGEIAAGVTVVAGAVAVGVAVARWLPHAGFGVLAVFVVSFLQARFMDTTAWPWSAYESHPGRFLVFLVDPVSTGAPELEVRRVGWHLAYLAGLVLVMAVVAVARDGLARPLRIILAGALVVVGGAAWAQTRPPTDGQVAEMVSYLTDPRPHQTCTDLATATYCAFDEQTPRVQAWAARVDAIRALLPAGVAQRDIPVIDRVRTVVGNSSCNPVSFYEVLHPRVRAQVSPAEIWPADGAVHPGTDRFPCGGRDVDELFTAMQIGSFAVGLPPSPHGLDVRCVAGAQARAAIAVWLAAKVTPGAKQNLEALIEEHGFAIDFQGWDEPAMLGARFRGEDLSLALAMLELPTEQVKAVLHADWATLVDPTTPADVLAARLGITRSRIPLPTTEVCG